MAAWDEMDRASEAARIGRKLAAEVRRRRLARLAAEEREPLQRIGGERHGARRLERRKSEGGAGSLKSTHICSPHGILARAWAKKVAGI